MWLSVNTSCLTLVSHSPCWRVTTVSVCRSSTDCQIKKNVIKVFKRALPTFCWKRKKQTFTSCPVGRNWAISTFILFCANPVLCRGLQRTYRYSTSKQSSYKVVSFPGICKDEPITYVSLYRVPPSFRPSMHPIDAPRRYVRERASP